MRRWMVAGLVLAVVLSAAATAFAATGKPLFVQHPYTAKQKMKTGVEFRTWGYIAPRVSDLTSKTVDILVYKRTGPRSWELTATVAGTLTNVTKFKHTTRYEAFITLDPLGQYRMRAQYSWVVTEGVTASKLSHYKYFRIVK